MSGVEMALGGLSREQREKLEQSLLARRKAAAPVALRARSTTAQWAPLSMAQQRLWLHETLEECGALYNMPCALRLTGPLVTQALQAAIALHVRRHAVLRSYFMASDGKPRQACGPVVPLDLPLVPLADEDAAWRWMRAEADRPFDLEKPGLLRCHLLQLAPQEHILVLTMHHIVSDGWSLGIMVREISQAYDALCRGEEPDLPGLPVQYVDYSLWQREWLQAERVQRQLSFWADALRDAPKLLPLPLNRQRPAHQSYQGRVRRFAIDGARVAAVRQVCREQEVTLHMLLLAAFNVLLSRYSASNDIVVGSPVANRFPQEAEALVGFFVNTLALRNRVEPEAAFSTFLQQVKKNALAAYAHQDVPFDMVVEYLKPERSQSHSPIFQVEFVLQQSMARRFSMQGLQAEVLARDSSYTKFDLTLSLEEGEAGLYGLIEYNSTLFDDDFAGRMALHYQTLLASIVRDVDQPVWSLDILTPAELNQLQRWAVREPALPVERGVLDYFGVQVASRPDAVAVRHGAEQLSYLELERCANRLAHAMRAAGVDAGQRVALYLERGLDYLAAMLAALKLGAIFVPFNPEQGAARNATMLTRTEPALILLGAGQEASLPPLDRQVPVLPIQRDTLTRWPDSAPAPAGGLDATAYMLFTSGSTGEPKGAMVSQRGMVNHLLAKAADLVLTADDAVAQIAVQTFDVSVWQFLVALVVGARTQVLTGAQAWEPVPLLRQLQERRISIVETVPSHLDIVLNEVQRAPAAYRLPALRWMISNGEPLAMSLCARWFDAFPATCLMNAYGPTECSDDVTHLCLSGKPDCALPYLPLGTPIVNASIHVLDDHLKPVPVGVSGEIHIGGLCVGHGYFRDEEKTRARFVDDVISGKPGARLYKSGDLGRYHADGTLELLGRCDFQLKIRGCRIEAGEVEAALLRHPAVEQCLVIGSKDAAGQVHLLAYVVSHIRPTPSAAALQAFCKGLLPDYMVPHGIIFLDEFPLLANGKINREQLPALSTFDLTGTRQYVAPQNPMQASLAKIWAAVIGLERVGIRDNFFQIGGHSLLAVELVAHCQEVLGADISLQQLFDHPTIEELAEVASHA